MEQSICILGDSIAKGVVFDTTKNRYTISKNSFANRIANRWNVSVKNLSKFGSTVTDGVRRFLKQKDELEDCQTVFMNFGGNDSDFQWARDAYPVFPIYQPTGNRCRFRQNS